MSKFKVGDKVVIYADKIMHGIVHEVSELGSILTLLDCKYWDSRPWNPGYNLIAVKQGVTLQFYAKQCRKLVKVKKKRVGGCAGPT